MILRITVERRTALVPADTTVAVGETVFFSDSHLDGGYVGRLSSGLIDDRVGEGEQHGPPAHRHAASGHRPGYDLARRQHLMEPGKGARLEGGSPTMGGMDTHVDHPPGLHPGWGSGAVERWSGLAVIRTETSRHEELSACPHGYSGTW